MLKSYGVFFLFLAACFNIPIWNWYVSLWYLPTDRYCHIIGIYQVIQLRSIGKQSIELPHYSLVLVPDWASVSDFGTLLWMTGQYYTRINFITNLIMDIAYLIHPLDHPFSFSSPSEQQECPVSVHHYWWPWWVGVVSAEFLWWGVRVPLEGAWSQFLERFLFL